MKPTLTIGFSVYGQPKMLAYWFEQYALQDEAARAETEVIVVDDAGKPPAEVPTGVRLFRVTKDIPWNQGGCRNLIAEKAKADRLMLIDPDMTLGKGMLAKLVAESKLLTAGLMFRPALRHVATEAFDHSSPNVHLLLRQDFLQRGGYDEDYCGNKGWSDVQLLRVFQASMVTRQRDDLWFWFHHTNKALADAQVNTLNRSVQVNKSKHIKKIGQLKKLGWRRFVQELGPRIRFPWLEVQ